MMINHDKPSQIWLGGHHDTPSHEEGGTLVHPIWYTSNVGKTIPPINMVIWGMVLAQSRHRHKRIKGRDVVDPGHPWKIDSGGRNAGGNISETSLKHRWKSSKKILICRNHVFIDGIPRHFGDKIYSAAWANSRGIKILETCARSVVYFNTVQWLCHWSKLKEKTMALWL